MIVGPLQHHSNLIPWRESNFNIINSPLNSEGLVDLEALRILCERFKGEENKYCTWNAASNVTGEVLDLDGIVGVTREVRIVNR